MQQILLPLLEKRQYHQAQQWLQTQNLADTAAMIEQLPAEYQLITFRLMHKDLAADLFAYLSPNMQQQIVQGLSDSEVGQVIDQLAVDDAVDFLEEMPAGVVTRVLRMANPQTRAQINALLQYDEDTAGSLMTPEFVDLRAEMTVAQAFERIRLTGPDKETIYTGYVMDESRHLQGVVTARMLMLASPDQTLKDLMQVNMPAVTTHSTRQDVMASFRKYDLLALPVVDRENRLVGIITVDDVVDVIDEEATEDFEKMAAIRPSQKPYLQTSIVALARNRIVWLLVLMVSAMLTGGVLGKFEQAISTLPLLVTFIPMITGTGGNAGSQAATLIIRGMAQDEIHSRDVLRVAWKELRVGLLVGLALAAANAIRLLVQYPGQYRMAMCVAFSMLLTVVLAKMIGGLLPMLAKACRLDPAIMAAPLISTLVDALSLVFFFTIAQLILL